MTDGRYQFYIFGFNGFLVVILVCLNIELSFPSLVGTAGFEPTSGHGLRQYADQAPPSSYVPNNGNSRVRTYDTSVNSRLLYLLSYAPIFIADNDLHIA